jgi:hypothetical protein
MQMRIWNRTIIKNNSNIKLSFKVKKNRITPLMMMAMMSSNKINQEICITNMQTEEVGEDKEYNETCEEITIITKIIINREGLQELLFNSFNKDTNNTLVELVEEEVHYKLIKTVNKIITKNNSNQRSNYEGLPIELLLKYEAKEITVICVSLNLQQYNALLAMKNIFVIIVKIAVGIKHQGITHNILVLNAFI